MFQPSLGLIARGLRSLGVDWNPLLNGEHAMVLVIMAGDLEADQLQFSVLSRWPAVDPAIGDRGGGHRWRPPGAPVLDHHLSAALPYGVFSFGCQHCLRFLRHLWHHRRHHRRGPAKATETLVYKVFFDGRLGGDLGGSAAQSVILMIMVIALTGLQFRFIERKVTY